MPVVTVDQPGPECWAQNKANPNPKSQEQMGTEMQVERSQHVGPAQLEGVWKEGVFAEGVSLGVATGGDIGVRLKTLQG